MARWIGLRIGLCGILLLAALALAVRADDSASTSLSGSTSPPPPRYPKGFGSNDDHVEQAAYKSPLDHGTNANSEKRSDVRPPTPDLRSPNSEPQSPIGGAAHSGSDAASRGARRELPPTPSTGPALLSDRAGAVSWTRLAVAPWNAKRLADCAERSGRGAGARAADRAAADARRAIWKQIASHLSHTRRRRNAFGDYRTGRSRSAFRHLPANARAFGHECFPPSVSPVRRGPLAAASQLDAQDDG